MATISEYTAEMLDAAARNLKGLLRSENDEHGKLVQKGLLLFRQGLVHQLRFDGDKVSASVQDVTPVYVKLDLEDLEASTCSCPVEGFCRHQMAVFFQALAQVGSVATWVEDWRQPLKARNSATILGMQTARDLLKSTKKLEANYEDWTATFSGSFESIMYGQGRPNPYVVGDLFNVYWRRVKADSPVELEWRYLYELIAAVQSFLMLAGLSEEFGHTDSMVDRYYRNLFHTMIEDVEKAMIRLSVSSMPFAFDGFIEKLKDDARGLLAVNKVVEYEGIHLYRLLWSQMFKKSQWRGEERQRLYVELERCDGDLPLLLGLVHQHILARNDEQALDSLAGLETKVVPYLLYWMEVLSSQKEWKRVGPFVEQFVSRLHPYLEFLGDYDACVDFTGLAMDLVAPYCDVLDRVDLFERTLVQCLPYSFRVYDTFLYKQGSFEKWIELQAFIGFDLHYMDSERIKEVQKREPAALLPLYHQAIQASIELKNRGGYREAVRMMKKVRTIYKKLDRLEDWERFFELLQIQTKRLRAFQEECIRGKLTHA
ncbi:SWIM zinc finger family protein [Neobacillus sp. LXY-4]|uniref:SWIM zinc finger family protein n=1 Tax=Neobacillus sp. LXY-4 TaxID=3379826 RepID=UPI003EE243E0